MDELTKQHQRLVLEVACKSNDIDVWAEALSSQEMFLFILKNQGEVGVFLKDYNFPLPLVNKLREIEESVLSTFLW